MDNISRLAVNNQAGFPTHFLFACFNVFWHLRHDKQRIWQLLSKPRDTAAFAVMVDRSQLSILCKCNYLDSG